MNRIEELQSVVNGFFSKLETGGVNELQDAVCQLV